MKKKLIDFTKKHTYLSACICTLFVFLLFWALNAFRFANGSYEEYAFSMLLSRGDDVVLFLGVFLSKTLVFFQNLIPFVNVFTIFLIISGLASFTILNYVLLKKFALNLGLLLSLVFDCLLLNVTVISMQWTHTSTVICLSSVALIFYSLQHENRKNIKMLQCVIGSFGVLLSSQLRFDATKVCLVFSGLFCICFFIRSAFDNNEHMWKLRIVRGIKESFSLILAVVLMIGGAFLCSNISETIKNHDDKYKSYVEYYNICSKTEDYPIAQYETNRDFYSSVGIYSKGDFDLLTCFKLDKDFFSVERLETISQYAQEHDSGIQNIYLAYFRALQNKVENILGNRSFVYPLLGFVAVIIFALLFVLYKSRNRIKPVFLILFCCIWVAFILYTRSRNVLCNDVLILIFFVLSVVIAFIGNRYQFISLIVFNFSVLLLYNYMMYVRLGFRVGITFIIPATFFMLMLFNVSDIRKGISAKYKKNSIGQVSVCLLSFALVVLVQSRIGVFYFNTEESKYDFNLVNYINSNSDSTFFFDWYGCELVDHAKYNPLVVPDFPGNSIHYSSWPMSSHLFDKQLNEHNIKHLHKEMINSNSFRFIISKKDEQYITQLEDFYNTHYKENSDIALVEVYSTDKAWVYKVVEK